MINLMISMIAAMSNDRVIADDTGLPWGKFQKSDLRRFRTLTENHIIVLGKNTFNELTEPLVNRRHIVVTHESKKDSKNVLFKNFEQTLEIIENLEEEVFIIGGEQIFKLFLPYAEKIYLTEIKADYDGRAYFPNLDMGIWKETSRQCHNADSENRHDYCFVDYERTNSV